MRSASSSVLAEYQRAPQVTRDRMYLDTMQQIYSNVTKVLVESRQGSNLLYLPLDKIMQQVGAGRPRPAPSPPRPRRRRPAPAGRVRRRPHPRQLAQPRARNALSTETTSMNRIGFIVSSLLVALALLSSMLFVVDQRQFGVVYALGQIKEVITEPGLNFKLPPPFQNVSLHRQAPADAGQPRHRAHAHGREAARGDRLVRALAHHRPARSTSATSASTRAAGANQLNRVVRNAFQEEINRRTVRELLSARREQLMADVKREVLEVVKGAKPWGIDVVDVRITRADYVEAITESVYRRMEAERKRVANELRSTGAAEGEKIRADADRQREVIDGQRLPRRAEDQGRGRCAGRCASTPRPSAAIRSSRSSTAAWRPTRPASTRRAT